MSAAVGARSGEQNVCDAGDAVKVSPAVSRYPDVRLST
jgi:hypothetical protein